MRPDLFNLYIADFDKVLGKRNIEEIRLGKYRIWLLTYADNMVLMTKNREAMIIRIHYNYQKRTLKRFFEEKELEHGKNKNYDIYIGQEKNRKIWKWDTSIIKEVENFKYFGFIFNRKGNYIDHIKELNKKGRNQQLAKYGIQGKSYVKIILKGDGYYLSRKSHVRLFKISVQISVLRNI